jgi:DNA-directed DNA polymerase III PolC
MIRTGYSFHTAIGHIPEVISRLSEIGATIAPISDRNSTFGFIKWNKAAKKAGLRPVFGVELAVTPELAGKKSIVDWCRFIAIDSIQPLNELIELATANSDPPMLLYKEALNAKGLIKIFGERARIEYIKPIKDVYIGLSPAVSLGFYEIVQKKKIPWLAIDSNFYPKESDKELYRIALGRRAETRTYPSHILSTDEWRQSVSRVAKRREIETAIKNRSDTLKRSIAEIKTATIFIPNKPKSLRTMCIEGAKKLNCDLTRKVYKERLIRELQLIEDKKFEDYFYIIADMISYAKSIMVVGPARGSSCGSLVCYLLGITTIDPIPYHLIFERFIDVTRIDLPDIDIDFSDQRRHLVFEYAEKKYGKDHVARLGTVMQFQPTSALNQAGLVLRIPKFKIEKTLEGVIERSSGDSRANNSLEDTLKETPAGQALIKEYPEIAIAGRMEGHPNSAGKHAAGIVITKEPVNQVVAIDSSTGATMCDKYDAEEYKLLKIDALGLTQLSIIERTLELIGEEDTSNGGYLQRIPLNDTAAFEVINNQRWPGIFQYNGSALQSLAKQFKADNIEDIVSVTALARPGPLASGNANEWVKRRNGSKPIIYPHPLFEKSLSTSLGVVIYQEQVMEIGRDIGDLTWEDVTQIRKAMSKSMGKEFFNQFGDRWKAGGLKKGIQQHVLDRMWDDLCAYGSWSFNRSHAVAYGTISYWCCYLKAHFPLEFAAATLDAESASAKQLAYLRELKEDGVDYIPVDANLSTDRWVPVRMDNRSYLVGPLSSIKGIGPKAVDAIMNSRKKGTPIPAGIAKKLANAKTEIDSLYPVSDHIKILHPDLTEIGIRSPITPIKKVQCGIEGPVVIAAVATRIAPRNANDLANVAKRGKKVSGPEMYLNMFLRDDSDEMYCKIDRYDYDRLAQSVIEHGNVGKALYAIKGTVPADFRMIKIDRILHLGDMDRNPNATHRDRGTHHGQHGGDADTIGTSPDDEKGKEDDSRR